MAEQIVRVILVLQILELLHVGTKDVIGLDIGSSIITVLANTSIFRPARSCFRSLLQKRAREATDFDVERWIKPMGC
jgi:hypothetical protein